MLALAGKLIGRITMASFSTLTWITSRNGQLSCFCTRREITTARDVPQRRIAATSLAMRVILYHATAPYKDIYLLPWFQPVEIACCLSHHGS